MALIQCPECGKDVSDKVKACPHCGYPMEAASQQPNTPQPVEVTAINLSPKDLGKTKKIVIGVVAVLCVVLAIVIGLFVNKANAEKQAALDALNARNAYIDNLGSIREAMIMGAIDAEKVCILTHDVWYNTIHKEYSSDTAPYTRDENGSYHDDFNDSISALYADEEIKSTVSGIKSNRDSVDELMKQLQNPTDEFSACYATLDSMYDAYCGLTNLAASPTGSLSSYTETYRSFDGDFARYYEKLATQIPEKQEQ